MANGFVNIPDWFSWDNQGLGVAITDLENNGSQNLFVMTIDSPPGCRQGFYRVGKQLDGGGNVTCGWTPWIQTMALLLADGRVLATGSNPAGGHQVPWLPPDSNEELHMEVYSLPYLFKSPRSVIDSASAAWKYGQQGAIQTQQAGNIRWASLIKTGVTIHSFNNGQRLVDLDILSQGNNVILATLNPNPNITPPG
jgi:hypothetical protein